MIHNQIPQLWQNPGKRENSSNPFTDELNKDVCSVIFKFCDLSTLKSLTQVDSTFRTRVLNIVKYREVLDAYGTPPKVDLEMSKLDKLHILACKVEMVPGVGSLVAVPRFIGGLTLSICFAIGKEVNHRRMIHAENDATSLEAKKEKDICGDRMLKAVRNMAYGLASNIPLVNIASALKNMDEVIHDAEKSQTIRILDGAICTIDWMMHMKENVLPRLQNDSPNMMAKVDKAIAVRNKFVVEKKEWGILYYAGNGSYEMAENEDRSRKAIQAAQVAFAIAESFNEFLLQQKFK